MSEITYLLVAGYSAALPICFHARFCCRMREGAHAQSATTRVIADDNVGLVYNYRNSLSEDFTGDAKNVL